MNLVREKVIHKKYGTGEITKLDNDHVYVKFQSVDQEKIFKYPSCFDVDGYLTLENQDIKTTKTSTTRNLLDIVQISLAQLIKVLVLVVFIFRELIIGYSVSEQM